MIVKRTPGLTYSLQNAVNHVAPNPLDLGIWRSISRDLIYPSASQTILSSWRQIYEWIVRSMIVRDRDQVLMESRYIEIRLRYTDRRVNR